MAKKRKTTTEKAPAIDRLMKPAIGIGIALLAYQFFQGLGKEIQRIDLKDELTVKTVFENVADNERYIVLCHPEDATYPLSSVFIDAHKEVSSTMNFKIVDCEAKQLDNGKSIVEEYGSNNKKNKLLDVKKRPTIFVTNPLQQIPTKHLKTGHFLAKALRNLLEKRANKVETTQDLRGAKCLSKDYCGVLLKGTKSVDSSTKKAYHRLMEEFPQVEFAAIDTTNLYVWNLEDLLPETVAGQHRFVVFKKVSGSTKDKDAGRLITSFSQLRGSVSHLSMSNLVTDVLNGSVQPQKLSSLPMIKTRTKKLLEQESAKRERRKNASQQKASSSGRDTPAGMFADNDGSREGRRAERERRRQEHYQKTGFKPKTPEEQAEMERQRRLRMEEEAAKWNMAPDDAPPEGEKVSDGDESDGDSAQERFEEYYIDEDGADEQDEDDDEEIMDLD